MSQQKRIGNKKITQLPCPQFDLHALQVATIRADMTASAGISYGSTSAADSGFQSNGAVTTTIAFFDDEYYLDSQIKLDSSNMVQGSVDFDITSLNDNKPSVNLVKIQMSPFYFPKLTWGNSWPNYFYYNRVFLLFNNLPYNQTVHAQSGMRFHFEFTVNNQNGAAVLLTPVIPDFYFRPPVTEIRSLTCTFYIVTTPTVFKPIRLPADLIFGTITSTPPAAMIVRLDSVPGGADLDATYIFDDTGLLTAPGVPVFIYQYSGATGKAAITQQRGRYVTTVVDATHIEFAAITSYDNGSTVSMVVPKNRFAMHVRFTTAAIGGQPLVNLVHS